MKLIADFERFHVGQLDRGTICSCLFCLDRQNSSSYIEFKATARLRQRTAID